MKPFLKEHYQEKVVPELEKTLSLSNRHQAPKLEKIVINSSFGAEADKNYTADLLKDIASIAGQKPILTHAKTSVSNFKLREGMPIGVKVTLRGDRMWDFLFRLISVALPAIRDFQGIPAKFDGRGNYTLGVNDHTIFPEISADTGNSQAVGMDICFVTSATSDEGGKELLRLMGMPFRKQKSATENQNN